MSACLELASVTAGYTRAPILHDVSLSVGPGEIVGLLGANGAGKTTVLKAVSGTLRPWRGAIRFQGEDITRLSPWGRVRRGVVHVPAGRRIFGSMTVRENLEVGALARRRGFTFDDVFDLFPKLLEREHQRAGSMSGGEQQMLAIGRALMTSPQLLLVDEMSAGLAPVVVKELLTGLRAINKRGIAMIIVEQSPKLVDVVGDRLYLLEQGRVAVSGTFESVGGVDAIARLYLGVS